MALPVAWLGSALWGTIGTVVLRMFFWLLPYVVNGVVLALGLSYVTYVGFELAMDHGIDLLMNRFQQIPSELIDVVRLMGVQDAILILTSTATSCISIKALSTFTRWKLTRPVTLKA